MNEVRQLLNESGISAKARDEEKLALLAKCRSRLSENVLPWLDACYVLTTDGRKFPPLFGTGGNEGSGSYVSGFAQQIVACLIEHKYDDARDVALFGEIRPGTTSSQTPGHFSPPAAGGANSGQGFEGPTSTNPWDYLLAIEGACLWASGVARRCGQVGRQMAAFPFTVNVSGASSATLAAKDERKPKQAKREVAEMWLPLWSRPLGLTELTTLLAEGRANIGTRMATTSVDFVRAAAGLGVDRGITQFQRVAFLMRNGQNFMGISMGKFDVTARRHVDLVREIDPWLSRFRRAVTDKTPPRFSSALCRIERAIFNYCCYGGAKFFQAILIALGRAEAELATGESFRTNSRGQTIVRPLSGLTPAWIEVARDDTPEFILARSLAGVHDAFGKIGPVRANLEPVDWKKRYLDWADKDRMVVWRSARVSDNLAAVLERRLMDGARAECKRLPLAFARAASLDAIAIFLAGNIDEERLNNLLWGLMLARENPETSPRVLPSSPGTPLLPRAFALLKLLFLPFPLRVGTSEVIINPEPTIFPLLRGGRVAEACQIAMRRLRAAGLKPLPHRSSSGLNRDKTWLDASLVDGQRLAAALLFPVSSHEIHTLCDLTLRYEKQTDNIP